MNHDTILIVEAVVEKLAVKKSLFTQLDQIVKSPDCLFLSNTSTLSIDAMASVLPARRRGLCAGWHFFSPAHVMKLLEVIRIPETSDETYQAMMAWGAAMKKTCVTCKDTPGFIVNR